MLIVRYPSVAVIRDTEAIPYRQTAGYRRAREVAEAQRSQITHRVAELWAQNIGNSTSGMLRRPAGAMSSR
jgi:hypothetical protein